MTHDSKDKHKCILMVRFFRYLGTHTCSVDIFITAIPRICELEYIMRQQSSGCIIASFSLIIYAPRFDGFSWEFAKIGVYYMSSKVKFLL